MANWYTEMSRLIQSMQLIHVYHTERYPGWFNEIIPLLQAQVDKCHEMYSTQFPDDYARAFPDHVAARDAGGTGGSLWPGTSLQ